MSRMKDSYIHLPTFLYSHLNKVLSEDYLPTGEIISQDKVLKENLLSMIDSADSDQSNLQDVVFICIRKKESDNEYRYSIAAVPFTEEKIVYVGAVGFPNIPTIFINAKIDIIETIKRILRNLTFS